MARRPEPVKKSIPGILQDLRDGYREADIVGPAVFLASDLSAYVSGSIVMVDGGYRTV